jgi:3-hydroxyacyl-CoA dehydrogenase/enoyl-CoA hydratase/3-hydroxybutyryl-CoA epimerase
MLNYSVDAEGIATVELDYPGKSQNILNAASIGAYAEAMQKALADPAVKGIVVASAKKDFIAGGDLAELAGATDAAAFHAAISGTHKLMRGIELGGKPVAAALNGSALGGGMEIALGCHYRVAADNPKARFGFPEVTLGLCRVPAAPSACRAWWACRRPRRCSWKASASRPPRRRRSA